MLTSPRIRFCAGVVYVFLLIGLIETSAILVGQVRRSIFSHRGYYLSKLSESKTSYEEFAASRSHSPLTGWQAPPNTFERKSRNCLNELISENILDDGRRKSLADEVGAKPQVALFGDSFVYGDELSDFDTISSQLFRNFTIPAYNYGVGGFGPAQTLLRIKEKLTERSDIEIVVFGIMFENIRRMVNQFRPVYFGDSGIIFGVKPFAKNRKIVGMPKIADNASFLRYVDFAFRNDYWSRPDREVPYVFSLAKAIFAEPFKRDVYNKIWRISGKTYAYDYADEYLTGNLGVLIEEFDKWARETKKKGLVLFIPNNRDDLASPETFVKQMKRRVRIDVKIVQGTQEEWQKYNLKSDGGCHPSSFGAGMIAREIAGWVSSK